MTIPGSAIPLLLSQAGDTQYKIEKSLRFNKDDSAKLSRTFTAAGDQQKFTLSFWFKNCDADATNSKQLFCLDNGGNAQLELYGGYLSTQVYDAATGSTWYVSANTSTTHKFRDPSAWYHIVLTIDTTAGTTNADRQKIYINGEQLTLTFTTAYASPALMTGKVKGWNSADEHFIGMRGSSYGGNWLAAEYYFIDGQALDASSFGKTDSTTGQWVPIEYTGAYGPKIDQSETWSDGTTTGTWDHAITRLFNGNLAEGAQADNSGAATLAFSDITAQSSIEVYGFNTTVGTSEWTVTAGGSDYTVALPASSAAAWTKVTGLSFPVSLDKISNLVYRGNVSGIRVDGVELVDSGVTFRNNNGFYLKFNGTDIGEDSSGNGNDWTAVNLTQGLYSISSPNLPAWDHADTGWTKSNSDKNGTYTGSGAHTHIATSALSDDTTYHFFYDKKDANASGGWFFADTQNPSAGHADVLGGNSLGLRTQDTNIGTYGTYSTANSTSDGENQITGFGGIDANIVELEFVINRTVDKVWVRIAGASTWQGGGDPSNTSSTASFLLPDGDTIYFGHIGYDSPTYANFSTTAGDPLEIDVTTDSPTTFDDEGNGTGNYCTFNPLASNGVLSQGNLYITGQSEGNGKSSMGFNTGKWYAEVKFADIAAGAKHPALGFVEREDKATSWAHLWPTNHMAYNTGGPNTGSMAMYHGTGSGTTYSSNHFVASRTFQMALDMDNGKGYIGDGTTWYNSTWNTSGSAGNPATGANPTFTLDTSKTYFFWVYANGVSPTMDAHINFGQHTYKHTQPTGFKACNTANLPNPTIKDPSKHFDVSIWTGDDAASRAITGLNFQPDMVWGKNRAGNNHQLFDAIREAGSTKELTPSQNFSEGRIADPNTPVYGWLSDFNSDGFTVAEGTSASDGNFYWNESGSGHVAWSWNAGSANKVNTEIDQSQDWSSTSNLGGSTTEAAKAFLGYNFLSGTGTVAYDNTGNNVLTTAPLSGVTKLEIMTNRTHSGATDGTKITIDGTAYYDAALAANGWSEVNLGGATISNTSGDSIYIKDEGGSASALWAVRVNGKVLIDSGNSLASVPSIYAGDLTSSLYLERDSWSGSIALDNGGFDQAASNAFNGVLSSSTRARSIQNAPLLTLTVNPAVTISSNLYVQGETGYNTTIKATIGGTEYTAPSNSGSHTFTQTGSLTQITVQNADSSSRTYLEGIKIDGKLLVDTGVSYDSVPTIASTYRANPDAGFSIVSYTGNRTANTQVAHGLNAKADFIIFKNRTQTDNWGVYHKENGPEKYLYLNSSNANGDDAGFFSDTDGNSNCFIVGDEDTVNGTSETMIAYCWSEVEGYSKFGTFTGNGSADGPFVHCGLQPRYLLTKGADANDWYIRDTARSPFNVVDNPLRQDSGAEYSGREVDILSNGFKLRTSDSQVNSNNTVYYYAAFSESPFKYANAR